MNSRSFLRGLALALLPFFLLTNLAVAKPKKERPKHEGDIKNLVPEAVLPGAAKLIPETGEVGLLDPRLIHFTQSYISKNFSDNKTVADLVKGLQSGRVKAEQVPPLRIFEHNGALWSLDNRRLYCFKSVGLPVRVVRATPEEVLEQSYKYSTTTNGRMIEIRGVTDGPTDPSRSIADALAHLGDHVATGIDAVKLAAARGPRGASAGIDGLLDRRVADAKDEARDEAR